MKPIGWQPALGTNGLEMANDDMTPLCLVCGRHVGMHSVAFLMVRGSYMLDTQTATELFSIDPSIPLQPGRLPDGSYALSLEVNLRRNNAFAMHEECMEEAFELVRRETIG